MRVLSWVLIIGLLLLAPVCLASIEILGDILRNRGLQRRILEERKMRKEARSR